MTTVTRTLAEFAAGHRYEQLPEPVVAFTRTAVLNVLAAAVAGCRTRIGGLHVALAQETGGGRDESTIIGGGRASATMATYANSNLAFALDYEDVVLYAIHAGPIVVPAVLAMAERTGASGRDVINAIVLGTEIGARIGRGMQPSAERGSQVWGQQYTPFAACVGAGLILGLDSAQMDAAFGITGTYATVPSAYKYFGLVAETRPMREVKLGWGWMAMAGAFGALSAARGFGGGYGILDGDEGFWIMGGSDQVDFASMTDGLGDDYVILQTEFKDHPSIYWNHPPHHAIKQLKAAHGFKAEEVARIYVKGLGIDRIADHAPAGAVDAQFSLPYAIATTITGEPLGPDMYADDKLNDPVILALMQKTECEADAAADLAWFEEHREIFHIEVTLTDGRTLVSDVEYPRDKPPLGHQQIHEKFLALAPPTLTDERVESVLDQVGRLEELDDIRSLTAVLG